MEHDEALEFLATNRHGVLATYRRDGHVQLSPVVATVDEGRRVVISTRETAIKAHNLRRDARASLCAISARFFGEWHTVEGRVEIVPLPAAMDGLVDYYRRVSGEHPDWDEYRAAMERERRVLLRLTVERSGPRVQG